jgi:hypothetical protein
MAEHPTNQSGGGSSNLALPLQVHIARIDKARLLLREARTLPDIKKVKDIAEAARQLAKAQSLSRECQNYAALIALEATEKAGRLLQGCKKTPGKKPPATIAGGSEYHKVIEDAGIPERTARRWQELAVIPPEVREKYVEQNLQDGEITASGLQQAYKKTLPAIGKSERAIFRDDLAKALQDENLFPDYRVSITPAVLGGGSKGLDPTGVGFNVQFQELTREQVYSLAETLAKKQRTDDQIRAAVRDKVKARLKEIETCKSKK